MSRAKLSTKPDLEAAGCTQPNKNRSPFIRIAVFQYVHVLDLNTNVVHLYIGPQTFVCKEHELVTVGPKEMITFTPMKYCVINNPVIKSDSGEPVINAAGQVKVRVGDEEYRFYQDPFPLYPGEELKGEIETLPVVTVNTALRLGCLFNFDDDGVERVAGEEWLFEGPSTYYPRKEVKVVKTENAWNIGPNTALCVKALRDCVDRNGNKRIFGEEWLVRTPGLYLCGPYEDVVEDRAATTLSESLALHMKASVTHVDEFDIKRRIGDEWLITSQDTDCHICSVHEELMEFVHITVLSKHEYCVLMDPVDGNGISQLGKLRLILGETSFFLQPGERLRNGVEKSYLLKFDEGLILRAEDRVEDEILVTGDISGDKESRSQKRKIIREAGDQWLIRGPMEYVPPIEVSVVARRALIPLNLNEGIYVRNTSDGSVRAVVGQAYMLDQDEELWVKKLQADVIQLLTENKDPLGDRGAYAKKSTLTTEQDELDLTRVVTFRVPHNAAVQIYDYNVKKARVEFGPTLVMLGPDDQFTKLSLSAGKPKRPNILKSLCLLLGPDFCTDVITVETADHARLSLQLAYNWHFELQKPYTQDEGARLFSVPDFVGDTCKAIASRIRGAVAAVNFDDFHKHSAHIIRSSVFGLENTDLIFHQNNLHITSVDVQSVEPVDQRTRDALQKSVQLAIEITTNSQEAAARHEAERIEQEARGRLERQRIEDEAAAENSRRFLLETRILLAALESTGQAKAEAQSRAEASRIEGESAVEHAKLRAQAMSIETDAELERLKKVRVATLEYLNEKANLKFRSSTEEMKLHVSRFTTMVNTIGPDTIKAIATASSDNNLQMLSALGLQSTLITDGTTPVNLLSTAHGLIGQLAAPGVFSGSSKKARFTTRKRSSNVTQSLHDDDADNNDVDDDDEDLSSEADS